MGPSSATTLEQARLEVRRAYRSGSVGQVYAGLVWLAAAGAWWWGSPGAGMVTLVVGGAAIYPVTKAVCRLVGTDGAIPPGNPLREAGVTIPIVGAMGIPVAAVAALVRQDWFFPAFMVVIGAHYLPFAHLYGMRLFLPLGAGMWAVGLTVAWLVPSAGVAAGAVSGLALVGAGLVAERHHRAEFGVG